MALYLIAAYFVFVALAAALLFPEVIKRFHLWVISPMEDGQSDYCPHFCIRFLLVFGAYLGAALLTMALLALGTPPSETRIAEISFLEWVKDHAMLLFVMFPGGLGNLFGIDQWPLPHFVHVTSSALCFAFRTPRIFIFFFTVFLMVLMLDTAGCVKGVPL
jgi:hypothetical protein